jgi:integrase
MNHIEGTDIRLISRSEMESFVTRVRVRRGHGQIGKPATQRKDVAALRAFYKWLEEEAEVHISPARALHGPVVHNVNPKPIPDSDWAALWNSEMSPQLRAALGLGYFCGLRRQEIFSLTSAQISVSKVSDMARKGGGKHTLPWREMYEILVEWCQSINSKAYTPHQLRHSAATNLLRAGVPLHMVSALLNHSSPTITMRYVKATGDELAEWRMQRGL